MIKWKVTIKVLYYDAYWMFDTAEEAVEFAVKAATGRDEKGNIVSVTINGVFPEQEQKEEEDE